MATQANIYIDQGTDFSTNIDVIDDAGQVVDLTSSTLQGQARRLYSSVVLFTFTIDIGDATAGQATMSLSDTVTRSLAPGKYRYDVIVTMSDGNKVKLLEGLVFIIETVTGAS